MNAEQVDDRVAALLEAGDNITIDYDDPGNTITIASTGGGLDTEAVDDRVAAFLQAGDNVTLTHNDAANTLTISSTGGGGSAIAGSNIFDTIAAAQAVSLPVEAKTLILAGATTPGDSGQILVCKRVNAEPTHFGKIRNQRPFLGQCTPVTWRLVRVCDAA